MVRKEVTEENFDEAFDEAEIDPDEIFEDLASTKE